MGDGGRSRKTDGWNRPFAKLVISLRYPLILVRILLQCFHPLQILVQLVLIMFFLSGSIISRMSLTGNGERCLRKKPVNTYLISWFFFFLSLFCASLITSATVILPFPIFSCDCIAKFEETWEDWY